jgi:1-aminocyclopropane-1-carboxylate deaminase
MAIVRGDELNEHSNEILRMCAEWGMKFKFISREEYHLKDDYEYLNELKDEFRSLYIVPEGGKNFLGMVGCQQITQEIDVDFDDIWLAQGTCTTSIGIAMSAKSHQTIHAVPALKGFDSKTEIKQLMRRQGLDSETIDHVETHMCVHPEFHFGGYGKTTTELIDFITQIKETLNIPLDSVYTGKAFYGMLEHYQQNDMQDKTIVFLHTGGLITGKV